MSASSLQPPSSAPSSATSSAGGCRTGSFGKRRKPAILISAVSTVVTMYSLVHSPSEAVPLATLLFLTGFLLNVGYSAFAIYPAGLVTKEMFPLAAGAVGTGGQAGGALFPFLTGFLLDAFDWNAVFFFLGAASLLAFAVMTFVADPIEEPSAGTADAR
ncbi:MFS transporter [Methylobacterium sp. 1030]|uniref:MFS transporter n=1 Tax=Methylobacterium sp. 1030 TaxID=3156404 RepID=UPI00339547A2